MRVVRRAVGEGAGVAVGVVCRREDGEAGDGVGRCVEGLRVDGRVGECEWVRERLHGDGDERVGA